MPDSVQAILAARIDRLPAEEKLLLQSAAVIGRDVPLALLREVAGLTDEALRRAIAHLQETAFLYEARRFPDVAYTFTHSLTQSVSYESVLLSRRRALHARLVDEIERLYAGSAGGAGGAAGPARPARRGLGAGGDVLPAGRAEGGRAVRQPRGGKPLRAGARRAAASAGEPRAIGAGGGPDRRAGAGAPPDRRAPALPGPVPRGERAGRGTGRPAATGAGSDAGVTGAVLPGRVPGGDRRLRRRWRRPRRSATWRRRPRPAR